MAKRTTTKPAVTFNFYSTDQAVRDWWESIPSRERSGRLCDLIRQHIQPKPESLNERLADLNRQLKQIVDELR